MKYETYYTAEKLLSEEEAAALTENLTFKYGEGAIEGLTVRKVHLIVGGGNPSYCICMKNGDPDTMVLAKRAVQNDIVYRNYAPVTKEECARILEGRIDWMKDSSVDLFNDFYLQYSLNRIQQGFIEEFSRELITYSDGNRLLIDSGRRRVIGNGTDYLYPELRMELLPSETVRVEFRKTAKLPPVFTSVIHMTRETNTSAAAAS